MKTILFALTVLLFASCSQREIVLQVAETGEKVVMFNETYVTGDTVILKQDVDPLGDLCFEIDNNWISFTESYKYLDETGYYKAVVIQ